MSYTIYGDIAVVDKEAGVKSETLPAGFWTVSRDPLGNYSRSSFTINGANAGEIGVLLNKDQSLHSVFVIKKEHLTKSNNFAMGVTRPEIAQFAHNTSLVLRNFK